jgi:DNA-directed RNA polymerase beta' subunit
MVLEIEKIQALNYIQKYLVEASDFLIANEIKGKEGFVRSEIIGGTFSFSGRGVITYDNTLRLDEIDIPYPTAITAYQYRITHILCVRYGLTLERAFQMVNTNERNPYVIQILNEIIAEGQWVVMLREPTNNLASIGLFRIRRYKFDDDTISLTTEPLKGLNADFDGDALNLTFLPKELVPAFELFHRSCLTDRITGRVDVSLREWNGIALGIMSE